MFYYLVCYDADQTYDVCKRKNISKRKDGSYMVKYKRFGRYKARILLKHRSLKVLQMVLDQLTASVYVSVENIEVYSSIAEDVPPSSQGNNEFYQIDSVRTEFNTEDYTSPTQFVDHSYCATMSNKSTTPIIDIIGDIDVNDLQNETVYFEDVYDNCNITNSMQIESIDITSDLQGIGNYSSEMSVDDLKTSAETDPDYEPNSEEESNLDSERSFVRDEMVFNENNNNLHEINKQQNDTIQIETSIRQFSHNGELDISKVLASNNANAKRNFCLFCKKLVIKIARHLENIHKDENLVKEFTLLNKKCPDRLKLIETLRRQGNFIYNTNGQYNKGDLIVCRRPTAKKGRSVGNFETCYNCKGFFSKLSIKRHVDKCTGKPKPGERSVIMLGRKIRSVLHAKASDTLRNKIFPILQEDDVVKAVRHDELLILYCNQLCLKYRSQHNHKQIRSFIRLMGRFLLAIKRQKPTVVCMKEIFHPENYNFVINSVNEIARLKDDGHYYGAPSVASNMGTHLKKIGNFLIAECIKSGDEIVKKQTEDFIHLIQVSYSADVNRTALETQLEMSRHKKIELPLQNDLKKFYIYITKNRTKYQRELSNGFDISVWIELAKFTLLTLHIFNARRAGEIERILISDFNEFVTVDENTDKAIFSSLSIEGKGAAQCYGRIEIRGKLGRSVPVLLHNKHFQCCKLLLQYRKDAGVPEGNPYLFGLPSEKYENHKWLNACDLMRKYSVECGALRPDLLRGTKLRKHLATQSIFLNLQEQDVSDLAQFMGHAEKIHRSYYRLPVPAREISQISVLLEKAVGIERRENGSLEESSDEEILPCNQQSVGSDKNDFPQNSAKRCVSAIGYVKRTSWSSAENDVVKDIFKMHIENETLPSLTECRNAVLSYPVLQNRSPTQLKVHIQNIRNRIQRENKNVCKDSPIIEANPIKRRKSVKKMIWTTPEKKTLKSVCQHHFQNATLPTLAECRKLIIENPILQNRTPVVIKAKINNDIKKGYKRT